MHNVYFILNCHGLLKITYMKWNRLVLHLLFVYLRYFTWEGICGMNCLHKLFLVIMNCKIQKIILIYNVEI